ncbi:hypothetical protein ACAG24_009760 [Mycobacterium sp. pW049]|uniref:hypothetical protein n=1 Tax=[Mycobacterium] bulgaricum TaxID=3238985 RepID=UPI00351B7E41
MTDSPSGDDAEPLKSFNMTEFPSGERDWCRLIDHVTAVGDLAERHYLELKSDIDPISKDGAAKIAKFILGAANRDPQRASRYLGGHAVMILGVGHHKAAGLPRFESKDLVGSVQLYVGNPGPRWDFHRIHVDRDRDIVIIFVEPPRQGDPIWPCAREGFGLFNGRIYVRADGETREANHGEVRALVDRACQPPMQETKIDVRLSGYVHRLRLDNSVLEDYVSRTRHRLQKAAPPANKPTVTRKPWDEFLLNQLEPDERTREQYLEEIDGWEEQVRSDWWRYVSNIVAAIASDDASLLQVSSMGWLEEVEVKVQLPATIRPINVQEDPWEFDDLPLSPRMWGPQPMTPLALASTTQTLRGFEMPESFNTVVRYNSLDIRASADYASLTILINQLRPEEPFESRQRLLLWDMSEGDGTYEVSWSLTAKDHHARFTGSFEMPVADVIDISDAVRDFLV